MSILKKFTTGKKIGPPRAVIYGRPKSGKTTLMAHIPGIVMIPLEDGKGTLSYDELPQPPDYQTLVETLRELSAGGHPWKAVGIDGLTGVEELIRSYVTDTVFDGSFEKFMAYHKGFDHCAVTWVEFCQELDAVRRAGMSVWCAAHSMLETIDDVQVGSYTRVSPSVHKKVIPVLERWTDIIGYIDREQVATDKGSKEAAGTTRTAKVTGKRRLIVEDTGSFMAGNRFNLSSPIALPEDNPFGPLREALKAAIYPTAAPAEPDAPAAPANEEAA